MPTAEFFEQYGLFAVKDFLDHNFCDELCKEISEAPRKQGTFVEQGSNEEIVDENIKKRFEVTRFPEVLNRTIVEKLQNLMPQIADHYDLDLKAIQPPKYSIYETGDYYKMHVDSNLQENAADFLRQRKVSVIVFLNEESSVEKEGSYCGGNLTFHGLIKNEIFGKFGYPLVSEPGMLITFLPDMAHEVTPVTFGSRYAVTTWYI